ncbi:MFS transporter [Nocardioides sp. TF02-7]|uniref:MFS transporter n=1 Tax=Nocardioides sp. TF02-7 TaxID=2917724 RepID=UPI001F0587AD|nr:MFS transporter [Nocardioides sp. TF02-7]UMG94237.1 MFS transporter [Nocardioides sp. TF02-7]
MATTTSSHDPRLRTALPWPALLALGAATLVMVTAEMLPTAVLGPMSEGLGVPDTHTGQLVAVWALTVVLASLPLTRATRRVDRRSLVAAGLVALAGSSLLTAIAPSYAVVVGARLLGAAAVGLLWATANAHVADLVPEELLGRAVAVVLGGATLGMVLGTPVARLVADVSGWRAAFAVLAAAALVVAVLVVALVPRRPRAGGSGSTTTSGRGPLRPVLAVTGLVGLLLVGYYGAYTFLTRLGEPAADLVPGGMGGLLLLFGLASATGVVLAGRVTGPTGRALVGAAAVTAVALLALTGAEDAVAGLVAILLLGIGSGALPPLAQTEILRRAGVGHRDLASALIPVVFNGGIAVGAAGASLVVGEAGVDALPVPAAALVAGAAAGLALATRTRATRAAADRRGRPRL